MDDSLITENMWKLLISGYEQKGVIPSSLPGITKGSYEQALHELCRYKPSLAHMTGHEPDGFGGTIPERYELTNSGMALVEKQKREARQRSKEQALQDKRYRKDARRSWLQLLVTLFAGWLLGLLTPIDVWHWLSSLF